MNNIDENSHLISKYNEWINWDKNAETSQKIKKCFEDKDYETLKKKLLTRLNFGTAGLRGVMDAGYNAMNDLVIIQTSQGLVTYCLEAIDNIKEKGVIIGYDGRHNSQRFAHLAALAFISKGIRVFLFSQIVPTPFVAFSVLQLKCGCGIMITASHNPKDDNGFKVYWENGAQINTPHDKKIQEKILLNLEPWPTAWDISLLNHSSIVYDNLDEIKTRYFAMLESTIIDKDINEKCSIKFTYSAMHGVSHPYMTEAFKVCGFKHFVPVDAQKDPDPEFPTVKFPNPEEGKSALDLSFKTANENDSPLIFANDPDADRLAVAEKQENGEWKVFTGNEIGALLGSWLWDCYKTKHPHCNPSDVYMISSAVSSKILKSISKAEGFNFEETLTGFKWMANRADQLVRQGKIVLFVFEEAIGFMCSTSVLDKDGIASAMQVGQIAAHLYPLGITLKKQLENIYRKYGLHISRNSYFICHHPPTIASLFNRIRNLNSGSYPQKLGTYEISGVRDLTVGVDTTQPDGKPILPCSKSSQMITFYFKNNFYITLRTSGTEPKIKYYIELCALPSQGEWSQLEEELNLVEKLVISEWLCPELHALIERTQ